MNNKPLLISSFLLIAFFLSFTLSAQDFEVRDMHVSIEVNSNGYMDVNEKIEVYFPDKKRGINRTIEFKFKAPDGTMLTTPIQNIEVRNQKTKITRKNGTLNIRIGSENKYLDGKIVYDISYRVYNAFNFLEDRVEFYWNITGNDWTTAIQKASFDITMPDDFIIPDEDMVVYAGETGTQAKNATIRKEGKVVKGKSTAAIKQGSGITVGVNLPKGYIIKYEKELSSGNRSVTPDKPKKNDYAYPIIGLICAFFAGAYRKYGRTPHVSEIVEKFYPPHKMTSAEVGTFYDFKANTRDLISLVPEWGNRGLIEINSILDEEGARDIYFRKKNELESTAPEYERTLFEGIFKTGSQVFLTDLKEKYYTVLAKAQSQVKKHVMEPRLFDEKAKTYFHSNWSFLLFPLLIVSGIMVMIKFQAIISGILLMVLGLVILVVRFLRPKLSQEGQELHNELEGLKSFLTEPRPEKVEELLKENPKYLEEIFPYVVAFGIDDSWNKTIAKPEYGYYAPAWYIYHDNNGNTVNSTYSDFSTTFDVKTINTVFSSAPASAGGGSPGSSGGFSGGGGSSGGGFGGGGGSSW